jgi:hypothetical protein
MAGPSAKAASRPPPPPEEESDRDSGGYARSSRSLCIVTLCLALFHVASYIAWQAPASWLTEHISKMSRLYIRYTKTDQAWGMFAPDPLSVNRRMVVQAGFFDGNSREMDLTGPINEVMHRPHLQSVGKAAKIHDRLLCGVERQYERGYAIHLCHQLAEDWGMPIKTLTMIREYEYIHLDPKTFKTSLTNTDRAKLGTWDCATGAKNEDK